MLYHESTGLNFKRIIINIIKDENNGELVTIIIYVVRDIVDKIHIMVLVYTAAKKGEERRFCVET